MHLHRWFLFFIGFALIVRQQARAEDWPAGYIIAEHSQSPDGRFGILVESKDSVLNKADEPSGDENYINYLADLKAHQTLGKIAGSDYFENQNHRGLNVQWSADSKLCVASYWARFGFDSIQVLEPVDEKFNQVEIGEHIQKISDAAIHKSSEQIRVDIAPHFRIEPNGMIKVRAIGMNNPKQLEGVKTYYTYFRGTYNYPAKQWLTAEARTISSELNDHLDSALVDAPEKTIFVGDNAPNDFNGVLVQSEEEKAQTLDKTLNDVYQALRGLLPAPEFAKVKEEEKKWVKELEAASSPAKKSDLLAGRIHELQELLWRNLSDPNR